MSAPSWSAKKAFFKESDEINDPFKLQNLREQWHSQPAKNLRVIQVGAGTAGLLLAYKTQKNFTGYELVCHEKCVVSSFLPGRFLFNEICQIS